ncbi:PPOX class F420-dependent enzyme [Amycolatopsis antarctica]|uniref:PPOX class F420-dependent enzyme n=1 Tax=Amycolatopsis antarctica TaxID=1854586 RepID=A0A263CWK9_9PSEU|nr:PPOX class F420-dependent oxidoreductase [Amycolatopsis antarctica]OZM70523.1 PPOX class F420-dependent enzyme [Amycolatopsis antarctica]
MGSEFERLAAEKYLMLTTFRKNGDRVGTAVWAGRDAGELTVWTERDSGKVKRIRNNGTVELTACDVRGKKTHGATITGTARVLDDAGTRRVRESIERKYGLVGKVTMFFSRLRGGSERTVGLAISVDG